MDASRIAGALVAALPGLLVAGCAATGPPDPVASLDPVIAFSDPAMCRFTGDTAKLIGGLVRNDPQGMDSDSWIEPGEVPPHLRDRLGPITRIKHDEWWTIRTAARGSLWGLPLVAIEQDFPVGGDAGGIAFEFDAPARAVERAARERGFTARAGKAVAMGVPDGMAYEIALHPLAGDPSRALLTCGYS